MRKIENEHLRQLLLQLRFTPANKRRQQLQAAEKLFMDVDRDKQYPVSFVFYRITGFHPKSIAELETVSGEELADDLWVFIGKLSGQLAQPAAGAGEKIYTSAELAQRFAVSTKTISRWRKRGLVARKYIFEDGGRRFGFAPSMVEMFVKRNPHVVAKARGFARMDRAERTELIERARLLAQQGKVSRYQVIEQLAAESGRSHETIRLLLTKHDQAATAAGDQRQIVFTAPPGVLSSSAEAELYKLYCQGTDIAELTERFERSKSTVYRVINRGRARRLLAKKIEFITSEEFEEDLARERILGEQFPLGHVANGYSHEGDGQADGSDGRQSSDIDDARMLSRGEEMALFRRYNFLKYLAYHRRRQIDLSRVRSGLVDEVEQYLTEAERVKKRIIEANLRLVVSIARKHTVTGANLQDLISEGNFSLMRAVEKFDYLRGVRFGTYASWAIAKDFARRVPAERGRFDRAGDGDVAEAERDFRLGRAVDFPAIERARQSLVQVIRNELDEREQYVILNHFALMGSLVKKEKKTLKEIGEHLHLSKERVRQIELGALQKLRHSLSIEQFEMLTE